MVVSAVYVMFHKELHFYLVERRVLRANNPTEEAFAWCAGQAPDTVRFLERSWATAKVPHRNLVISFLRDHASAKPAWWTEAEKLIVAGTADPDTSVRELALAALQLSADQRLFACARAQLTDPDPEVRQLGLTYLRQIDPRLAVPAVVPLLDDPDLQVAGAAELALARWTGEDFGVHLRDAIAAQNAAETNSAAAESLRQGIQRRKTWWQAHASDYPPLPPLSTTASLPSGPEPAVEDFKLRDLAGNPVRLSQMKGKTVLLNFWATWCTACLAEIPDLITLQRKLGDGVFIVGIALDGVPDEHGHSPDGESDSRSSYAAVHKKVAAAVKARGINYRVLLDPEDEVGRRFNGGELPTTVIIDSAGHLRRRFLGERSVETFEQMIANAEKTPAK